MITELNCTVYTKSAGLHSADIKFKDKTLAVHR